MSIVRRRGERQWLADAFGAALRNLAAERNFDNRTLAERSGIELGVLGRLLSGVRLPDLDTLFVLARALNLSPEAIVARTVVYSEQKRYEHDVPVLFQRSPRIFRLVGSDGRETGGCYGHWFEAEAAAVNSSDLVMAVTVYSRVRIVELPELVNLKLSSPGKVRL